MQSKTRDRIATRRPVFVLGRFPPPFDGQTLATERIASLLDDRFDVRRLNTQAPTGTHVRTDGEFSVARLRHYLGLRSTLANALADAPATPVLWNSLSPIPLGHWRDVLTTVPAFQPDQPIHAVMHRATFERLLQRPHTTVTAHHLVRRVTTFVFQSRRLAEACSPWIPESKWRVIPNTLDDAVVCTPSEVEAKHAAYDDRTLRVFFLGNMVLEKGYLDVLRAIALLRAQGHSIEADFVGGWAKTADRDAFEREAAGTGLGTIVRHHGAIADRSVVKALHLSAHVFVLPTYHPTETQPKAVLEALGSGTPVVMTNRPIAHDMITDGSEGILVPARTPKAIARALLDLHHPQRWHATARRARERFETTFSPNAVRGRWEALLDAA